MSGHANGKDVLGEVDTRPGEPLGTRPHIGEAIGDFLGRDGVYNATEVPQGSGEVLEVGYGPAVNVIVGLETELVCAVYMAAKGIESAALWVLVAPALCDCC